MIRLVQTCEACPEQYDAFDETNNVVGYLRLRHGTFRVDCPDAGGTTVYTAYPEGDGIFDADERDYYLRHAVFAIEQWIADPSRFDTKGKRKPPAPDVKYTVE